MMLVPYIGELPLEPGNLKIVTDPDDQKRVDFMVARAQKIARVDDLESMNYARRIAGQIKTLEDEISAAKKAAKMPHRLIENAIEDRCKEIFAPLLSEKERIAKLLGGYVQRLEELEKLETRKRETALQAQIAEQQRRLAIAEQARKKAEQEAREAISETEKMRAMQRANAQSAIVAQAELAQEIAQEAAQIGSDKAAKGKIPGGQVDYRYEFKVINLGDALKAGLMRLFRWEIDKRACNKEVRDQLEWMPDAEPKIPGIEITKTINVSVRSTVQIQ